MRLLPVLALLILGACAQVVTPPPPEMAPPDKGALPLPPAAPTQVAPGVPPRLDGRTAVRNFVTVVETIEPVAEEVCRQQSPGFNCDFQIFVDDTINAPPNAFQTEDEAGNPIIVFTVPLIAEARNQDELAFILAHEAAHHIEGHLSQARRNAAIGAGILTTLVGGAADARTLETAQQLGAAIGARTYSKEFELEADALGALIAKTAGYDPLRGAEFFFRIPDPGDSFLGTHPPNAQRFETVQRVSNAL